MESAGFSDHYPEVIKNLKQIYGQRIVEAEKRYLFDQFHGQLLRGSDFDAKPMVLLLGQYSVGKTSFIEFLLKRKFPGQRVGPEPTTDRYVAVMYGEEDQTIPGAALSVDPEQPFSGTNQFGSSFLSKFEAAKCNGAILKNLVLVDTPGVLSGEKQRLGRAYDFVQVSSWFAAKADLIILLFDAYKLDISDEFKDVILALKGNDDKIRCVLNKCDAINTQQLMRIYGALMWSLGKVIKTPEALRVYLGSFWDKPYQNTENSKLFRAESADLLDDLLSLPRNSAVRKVNELVKRTRLVIAHSHVICHLGNKMPTFFGKDATKAELIQNLAKEYQEIEHLHKIAPGDFPEIKKMQEILKLVDFGTFQNFSKTYFDNLNTALCSDLPKLMRRLAPPKERPDTNPFRDDAWVVSDSEKQGFDDLFFSLKPNNLGRLPGAQARKPLMETVGGSPPGNMETLKKIWELVDFEKIGALDSEEFAIAMHLCQLSRNGEPIPTSLPLNYYPINKRKFFKEGKSTTNPF